MLKLLLAILYVYGLAALFLFVVVFLPIYIKEEFFNKK